MFFYYLKLDFHKQNYIYVIMLFVYDRMSPFNNFNQLNEYNRSNIV